MSLPECEYPQPPANTWPIIDSAGYLLVAAELIYEHAIPAVRSQWDEVFDPLIRLRADTRPDLGDWELPWLDFQDGENHSPELSPARSTATAGGSQDRPQARLADMEKAGIHRVILHPRDFSAVAVGIEHDLGAAVLEAYNDFVAHYCSMDPARLNAAIQLHGRWPAWAIQQLRKHEASQHVVAVSLCLPSGVAPDAPALESVYAAVADSHFPLLLSIEEPPEHSETIRAARARSLVQTYLQAGILSRYPQLRLAVLNGGCRYILDGGPQDQVAALARQGRLGILSDLTEGEELLSKVMQHAGDKSLMWASGFPMDSSSLGPETNLQESFLHSNAQRFFRKE